MNWKRLGLLLTLIPAVAFAGKRNIRIERSDWAANKLPYITSTTTTGVCDLSVWARTLLDDADEAAFKVTVNLEPGVDIQAYSANLLAIAGLTSAADKGVQFTGVGTAATFDLTAFALTILDDADAAAVRATIGAVVGGDDLLADGSVPLTSNWDVGAFTLTGTQFISDIAIGMAPFPCTSTTVNTNLNADLLDGLSSAAFVQADGSVALNADWDVGAYTVTALKFTSDQITGTAPFTVASTTVVTNLNADTVDAKSSTDFCLLDGTQALTANWDIGPYTLRGTQFISDIAIGTAPFPCTSTTVNTNLNADRVDGKNSTDFCLLDGTQALTANWDIGPYTLRGTQFISDIAIGTAPFPCTSTTVNTNLNADRVDGKNSTDFCLLDGTQNLTAVWDTGNFAIQTLVDVADHTGNGNITAASCRGGTVTNTGAGGGIVLNLPVAVKGMTILVSLTVAQDVDINPQDGTQILVLTNAAGDAVSSDATLGSSLTLFAVSTTLWMPVGQNGTWTDVN